MARIRTIKPEIWLSPQVMNLAHGARLLFIGLITQADDDGRGSAEARRLKAAIFGGDDVAVATVAEWLGEIASQGLAILYEGGPHGPLYELISWRSHQAIDRPRKSNYPAPDQANGGLAARVFAEASPRDRRAIVEDASRAREGSDLKEGSLGRKEGPEGSQDARAGARMCEAELMARLGQLRAAYPVGIYRETEWQVAERQINAHLDAGHEWGELLAGAERYAAQCAATGKIGTQYVLSPVKFFDRRHPKFGESFPVPRTKAEREQDANIEAARTWLAQEGAA